MKIEFENGSVIEGIKSNGEGFRSHGYFFSFDVAKDNSDTTVITWKKNGKLHSGILIDLDEDNWIATVKLNDGSLQNVTLP